jgi:predicted GTPase
MIGDAYFQLRAQIGTSLFSLAKLARDLAASESALATLQELQAGLREPFLFVTLGESGAGKSSLLNALFERDFAGGPAFTGRGAVFRHSAETRDVPLVEDLVEAERPHIFLRDFTVVDAAGFDSPTATPEILRRFLPTADVVLFVFPARSESHAAWEFLVHGDRALLARFIFLLQQSDRLENGEVAATEDRLRGRLREVTGEDRPIFAVSAQTRAGLEKLERHLDAEVIGSHARFQKLREICSSADELLFQLGGKTRATSATAERKLALAATQGGAIAAARDEALRSLDRDLWTLAQIFEAAQRRGEELLRRRIHQPALWTNALEWRDGFQRELEVRVREGVTRTVQLAAEHCDATLRAVWNQQRAGLEDCGVETLGAFPDDCAAHVASLHRSIAECDPPGTITRAVIDRFVSLRAWARVPAILLALSAVGVVIAASTGHFLAVALLLALLAFAGTAFAPTLLGSHLGNLLRRTMRARREAIMVRVEAEMRAEIERVTGELKSSLGTIGEDGFRERAEAQPMLDRILQLAELFDTSIDEIEAREWHANDLVEPTPATQES